MCPVHMSWSTKTLMKDGRSLRWNGMANRDWEYAGSGTLEGIHDHRATQLGWWFPILSAKVFSQLCRLTVVSSDGWMIF